MTHLCPLFKSSGAKHQSLVARGVLGNAAFPHWVIPSLLLYFRSSEADLKARIQVQVLYTD